MLSNSIGTSKQARKVSTSYEGENQVPLNNREKSVWESSEKLNILSMRLYSQVKSL